jgi:RNA recognition motif-containing protein
MMMMDDNSATTEQVPTRSLWLGQLELTNQTSNELNMIFSKFGLIESIRILPDRECAFVNFSTVEEAIRARDFLVQKMGSRLFAHSLATVKVGFGKSDAVPQQTPPQSSPTNINTTTTTTTTTATTTTANFENAQGPTRALCRLMKSYYLL